MKKIALSITVIVIIICMCVVVVYATGTEFIEQETKKCTEDETYDMISESMTDATETTIGRIDVVEIIGEEKYNELLQWSIKYVMSVNSLIAYPYFYAVEVGVIKDGEYRLDMYSVESILDEYKYLANEEIDYNELYTKFDRVQPIPDIVSNDGGGLCVEYWLDGIGKEKIRVCHLSDRDLSGRGNLWVEHVKCTEKCEGNYGYHYGDLCDEDVEIIFRRETKWEIIK